MCSNQPRFSKGLWKSNMPCFNCTFWNCWKCKPNIWAGNGENQIWKQCQLFTPKLGTDLMTIGHMEMVSESKYIFKCDMLALALLRIEIFLLPSLCFQTKSWQKLEIVGEWVMKIPKNEFSLPNIPHRSWWYICI